jgi:hypothetical protein
MMDRTMTDAELKRLMRTVGQMARERMAVMGLDEAGFIAFRDQVRRQVLAAFNSRPETVRPVLGGFPAYREWLRNDDFWRALYVDVVREVNTGSARSSGIGRSRDPHEGRRRRHQTWETDTVADAVLRMVAEDRRQMTDPHGAHVREMWDRIFRMTNVLRVLSEWTAGALGLLEKAKRGEYTFPPEPEDAPPEPIRCPCTPHRAGAPPIWRTGDAGGRLTDPVPLCESCYGFVRRADRLPTVDEIAHHERHGRWKLPRVS